MNDGQNQPPASNATQPHGVAPVPSHRQPSWDALPSHPGDRPTGPPPGMSPPAPSAPAPGYPQGPPPAFAPGTAQAPPPGMPPGFAPGPPHGVAQVPQAPQIPRQPWGGQRSPAVDDRVVWFGADGSVHYVPSYPQPGQRPPRRRRWPYWVALGVVGALLLCGAPVAFVASRLPGLSAGRADAARPTPSAVPSPGPNAPTRVRYAWITEQIGNALNQQTNAVLSGDQKAFLATVDGKATKLMAASKRRFGSLRALQTTTYTQRIASMPVEGAGTAGRKGWKVRVDIHYCFVVKDCRTDRIAVDTAWVETSAGLRMTTLEQSGAAVNGPRPWENTSLKAAVGRRVVVATTNRYASRLPSLLREAEKAAAVADRFVINGERPDRYRVFVAGPSEWKRWYGGELPDWSVGFATAVSDQRMEVVLNANEIQSDYIDEVLRHELGHVATLSSDDYADASNFWLVEGMAEYIQESGRSVSRYDGRFSVRRYLDANDWDGNVAVEQPGPSADDAEVSALYGIGYYAVRRMAERFGRAKMVSFFSEVVLKQGNSLDTAARRAFGVSWSNVNADCAKYIRRNT